MAEGRSRIHDVVYRRKVGTRPFAQKMSYARQSQALTPAVRIGDAVRDCDQHGAGWKVHGALLKQACAPSSTPMIGPLAARMSEKPFGFSSTAAS